MSAALRCATWFLIGTLTDDMPVSLPPFEAITFDLGDLWYAPEQVGSGGRVAWRARADLYTVFSKFPGHVADPGGPHRVVHNQHEAAFFVGVRGHQVLRLLRG